MPVSAESHMHTVIFDSSSQAPFAAFTQLKPARSTRELQESPSHRIPAHHQTDSWCGKCGGMIQALELENKRTKAELEACKKGQGILKVSTPA